MNKQFTYRQQPSLSYDFLFMAIKPVMYVSFLWVLIQGLSATTAIATPQKTQQLILAIHEGSYDAYALKGVKDACQHIQLDSSQQHHRMLIELELLCFIFKESGLKVEISTVPAHNYYRALRMVRNGEADAVAESIWLSDVNPEAFYVTEPVIRKREFEKGIFTSPSHPLQTHNHDILKQLKQLSSVTFKSWHHDYSILKNLSKEVLTVVEYDSITRMITAGRADFSLLEFPNNNALTLSWKGDTLKPISGIKVQINDARAFVFSKRRPHSDRIFQAVNMGIQGLREKQAIKAHLLKHGVLTDKTKGWQALSITPNSND